jgi:hypothetical protein
MITVYRAVMGKPEVKSPLGSHRWRCKVNIKIHLQVVGCDCEMHSSGLA